MIRKLLVSAWFALTASPGSTQTDFTALSAQERAIFQAEIRAVLLAHPELALPRPQNFSAQDMYRENIEDDLELIGQNFDALFAPDLPGFGRNDTGLRFAVFVGPECESCDQTLQDLHDLTDSYPLRVTVIDRSAHEALSLRMGVDSLPFYVMPRLMLRGHMPKVVLERYLKDRTGQ